MEMNMLQTILTKMDSKNNSLIIEDNLDDEQKRKGSQFKEIDPRESTTTLGSEMVLETEEEATPKKQSPIKKKVLPLKKEEKKGTPTRSTPSTRTPVKKAPTATKTPGFTSSKAPAKKPVTKPVVPLKKAEEKTKGRRPK